MTIVSPFAAGGTADVLARILAEHLQKTTGHPVIVENKVGAGGGIGAAFVAKAKPDGLTLLVGSVSTHAINQFVYAQLPYDPEKDFEPISLLAQLPNLLVVNKSLPAKTVPELIAYVKANPDTLTFGSAGTGTSQQLSAELFKQLTGTKMTHVPYKGGGEIMAALVGGEISLSFNNMTAAWPMAKSGDVRPLAVTSLKRNPTAPDVPTVAETIPGFEATSWFGFYAPKGTPKPVIDSLVSFTRATLTRPDIAEKLLAVGAVASPMTPAEFSAFMVAERKKWKDIVSSAGIKAN
ncbi:MULTISPECIES: tripartite tricarboxylate transporter substrate binding protein [Rhodomicrobium]|uniref:Bug family tripartite tricarboxylate transporter substrate binding protein n=1 Tax=Rhodomicrobium TaxID=1068 RepID=UPI001FDA127B|nr:MULTISPECIES: tripartite tricarboxylate transporter substrate binding protein [Rhodomicrobium]